MQHTDSERYSELHTYTRTKRYRSFTQYALGHYQHRVQNN